MIRSILPYHARVDQARSALPGNLTVSFAAWANLSAVSGVAREMLRYPSREVSASKIAAKKQAIAEV